MKLAYPAIAIAKASAIGKCCEQRRRSRAQCLPIAPRLLIFTNKINGEKFYDNKYEVKNLFSQTT